MPAGPGMMKLRLVGDIQLVAPANDKSLPKVGRLFVVFEFVRRPLLLALRCWSSMGDELEDEPDELEAGLQSDFESDLEVQISNPISNRISIPTWTYSRVLRRWQDPPALPRA